MIRSIAGLSLLMTTSGAIAAAAPTDFGIRTVEGKITVAVHPKAEVRESASEVSWKPARRAVTRPSGNLNGAAAIGAQWGRVTSTYRSASHNKRVGGVRNSYHLYGRAIDIARRPGVSHARIAAAYRDAGYHLIESLDEGDHSHFAFGTRASALRTPAAEESGGTTWRIVLAPR